MWPWDTSSRRPGRTVRSAALGLAGILAIPAALAARVYLTVDEALAQAFPGCSVERTTVFLTDAQLARARELAQEEIESALVHPYRATCDGRVGGTAYFDSHRVRTLPETVMVAVDADGRVRRIEVLSFKEPPDYLPRDAWYEQFDGRALDDDLRIDRAIRPITGATLTARATASAVRRLLALDRILRETPKTDAEPPDGAKPTDETEAGAPEPP